MVSEFFLTVASSHPSPYTDDSLQQKSKLGLGEVSRSGNQPCASLFRFVSFRFSVDVVAPLAVRGGIFTEERCCQYGRGLQTSGERSKDVFGSIRTGMMLLVDFFPFLFSFLIEFVSCYNQVCRQLDALSHFHFTPRPVKPEMNISVESTASLALEDITPTVGGALGDVGNQLAPEQVRFDIGKLFPKLSLRYVLPSTLFIMHCRLPVKSEAATFSRRKLRCHPMIENVCGLHRKGKREAAAKAPHRFILRRARGG